MRDSRVSNQNFTNGIREFDSHRFTIAKPACIVVELGEPHHVLGHSLNDSISVLDVNA
jgi:hypothetical protein